MDKKINWIIEQHSSTNHFYDKYLPYEFHLRMVAHVAKQNIKLIEMSCEGDIESWVEDITLAAFGHDLIEDTRVSYNDVKEVLGYTAAEIIYAVTNEKGKNRKERGNDKYYEGIRNTPGAVFVKLCDRIANVQYSKMTGSRMFEMYRKENDDFMTRLGYSFNNSHMYSKMFDYLMDLFETK
jgi:(p)ppGpp synthase/HD superfamily hydrolase